MTVASLPGSDFCFVPESRTWSASRIIAMSVARFLVILGLVFVAAGLLWPLIAKLGLGRLPGDIVIERENFRLYLPLGTSVLISVILSLVLWLLSR
jgi:hypothetical protein